MVCLKGEHESASCLRCYPSSQRVGNAFRYAEDVESSNVTSLFDKTAEKTRQINCAPVNWSPLSYYEG